MMTNVPAFMVPNIPSAVVVSAKNVRTTADLIAARDIPFVTGNYYNDSHFN